MTSQAIEAATESETALEAWLSRPTPASIQAASALDAAGKMDEGRQRARPNGMNPSATNPYPAVLSRGSSRGWV